MQHLKFENQIFVLRLALLLASYLFSPLTTLSQITKIDSLKSLLPTIAGTERSEVLIELALDYGDIDYSASLKYANEASQLAILNGDTLKIVMTKRLISRALRNLGKVDSSLTIYNEILPIAKRNNYVNEVKLLLNGLATAYLLKAYYDKALQIYFESLELKKKNGDKFEISVALNNIALVYTHLADLDKALLYYKQALEMRQGLNNKYDLDILLLNISICYADMNNYSQAQNFVEQALSACGKNCSEYSKMISRVSLGIVAFGQKNLSTAEAYFLESYAISKRSGEYRYQMLSINYLVDIYVLRNQLALAEVYLKKAELMVDFGFPYNDGIIEMYAQLFDLYAKLKNFEKVAHYQNKYITLKDSIYNEKLTTNLMKIEADHLEKENKAKIEFQNKILVLNEEVIFRQKIVNISVGIAIVLVIVLAIVLARSNRRKKITNFLLDEKVKERTRELQMNRDALQRMFEERDAIVSKASTDIKSSIATIKGLCFLGVKDIDHPNARQYLSKVDLVSDHLSEMLNKMIYSYKI